MTNDKNRPPSAVSHEIGRLREALQFYADEKTYQTIPGKSPVWPIYYDGGERARQALFALTGSQALAASEGVGEQTDMKEEGLDYALPGALKAVSFAELGRDVHEASVGSRKDHEFRKGSYPGHQEVPFINFNSLARIVDKHRRIGFLTACSSTPPSPVGEVSAIRSAALREIIEFIEKRSEDWDGSAMWAAEYLCDEIRALIPAGETE